MTGQNFGRLTVLERAPNKGKAAAWLCKCQCGQQTITTGTSLRLGVTKSCGCLIKDTNKTKPGGGWNKIDITGQKYGRLTVVQQVPALSNSGSYWLCKCDCGFTTVTSSVHLKQGHTKSCGCLIADTVRARAEQIRADRNPPLNTKWCASCQQHKDLSLFSSNAKLPMKVSAHCKFCQSLTRRAREYNTTKQKLRLLLDQLDYRCPICKRPFTSQNPFTVDHDHDCCGSIKDNGSTCGKCTRGLLCAHCNRGLGLLLHDPNVLSAAIDYLIDHGTDSSSH